MYWELALVVLALISYLFFSDSYRRLKLPPGPIGLPIVGYLPLLRYSGLVTSVKINELSKKFGDIFSVYFGQYLVVFVSDVDMMKEMGKMDVFLGRNQLELMKPIREKCGLIFLEEEGWREWRRFTLKSLRDMGFGKIEMNDAIQDQVEDFRNFLVRNGGKPLYLKEPIEVSVLNALWIILANEKYDIEDPHKKDVIQTICEGFSDQDIIGLSCFLPWFAKLFPVFTGYSKALKCLGSPMTLAHDIVQRHRENHCVGQEKDFIDYALTKIYSTTDPNSHFYGELGMKNLTFTVIDIFFTGSDTVSSTMGWAFLSVAAHPQVQKKVQQEIDLIVGHQRLPSLTDKSSMVYTVATMFEVLRKSSMVPFGVMHTALEDTEYQGYFIPKRTIILWNLYGVHHDPIYWGDPHVFRPERFINKDGSLKKDDHLIPFFVGKRNCPGDSLAMNEIFMFFTGILQKFNVELEDKTIVPDLGAQNGFILKPPEHKLILTERKISDNNNSL